MFGTWQVEPAPHRAAHDLRAGELLRLRRGQPALGPGRALRELPEPDHLPARQVPRGPRTGGPQNLVKILSNLSKILSKSCQILADFFFLSRFFF